MCIPIHIETREGGNEIERDLMAIRRRLKREGWEERDGGSHYVYKHPTKPGRIVVPKGRGDLPSGTAANIAKNAGWQ
jgi:predicted RNA binding protein YcfA (HicA-like mRNA interferase family)